MILADEPTGNLDSKTGTAIMELMRRSCDELSQTIVMVTHDSRASAYADRVVFLKDGIVHSEKVFTRSDVLNDRVRMVIQMIDVLEL
jgi:putative ABC transport system ATP-binding protein